MLSLITVGICPSATMLGRCCPGYPVWAGELTAAGKPPSRPSAYPGLPRLPETDRPACGFAWPSFARRHIMKYGARNQLQGKVVEIKKGTVMCQVKVKIPADSTMCSVMTLESLADLGIEEGARVNVIAKAVNVLLTTD